MGEPESCSQELVPAPRRRRSDKRSCCFIWPELCLGRVTPYSRAIPSVRLFGGGTETDRSQAETCCICLDSLSAAPVTALLTTADSESPEPYRTCPHYLHVKCASRLTVLRCPLCRGAFDKLTAPISLKRLAGMEACDILAGIHWLTGKRDELCAPSAPASAVVELLAAIVAVPEEKLRGAVQVYSHGGVVDEHGLAELLDRLGITGNEAPGYCGHECTEAQLQRQLRCFMLRLAAAMGTAIPVGLMGMTMGAVVSGICSIPNDSSMWRFYASTSLSSSVEVHIAKVLAAALIFGAYHGHQHLDIVVPALLRGATFGLLVGLAFGFQVMDPSRQGNHGFYSVFVAGIQCQHLLHGWRSVQLENVDIFEAGSKLSQQSRCSSALQ